MSADPDRPTPVAQRSERPGEAVPSGSWPGQVLLPREVLSALVSQARAALPHECCGALVGEGGGDVRRIDIALPVANPAPAGRYALDATAVREAERVARAQGREVVGFYHSHPRGPAQPSAADVEAAWPWYTYLIVDAATGHAGAWRLAEDRSAFLPQSLRVEEA